MKRSVLFLCTGNTCRSQMAEAIVNARMREGWEAVSAGTRPGDEVNPFALRALSEIGIEHRGRPKSPEEFRGRDFDLVVTLCDNAAQDCPVWLGSGRRVHEGFPDPALARGGDDEVMGVYRRVRDDIGRRIAELLESDA